MSGRIRVELGAGKHVVRLVIDHPEKRNAITSAMAVELSEALGALERDDDVKVIIIAGAGDDLSSGADLDEIASRYHASEAEGRTTRLSQRARFHDAGVWWGRDGLFGRVLLCSKITIVAAQGLCHGAGMHLALYADLTIASDMARFAMPQWRHVGINGDVSMLVSAVGLRRAKEFIYCGAEWDASTALACGLIDGVTTPANHEKTIADLARSCALIMRDAVAAEKQVIRAALARMQIETGFGAAGVVAGWGANIHFRAGEFSVLREAKRAGVEEALRRARDHFSN
jgi:enoyl-CoA hydratase